MSERFYVYRADLEEELRRRAGYRCECEGPCEFHEGRCSFASPELEPIGLVFYFFGGRLLSCCPRCRHGVSQGRRRWLDALELAEMALLRETLFEQGRSCHAITLEDHNRIRPRTRASRDADLRAWERWKAWLQRRGFKVHVPRQHLRKDLNNLVLVDAVGLKRRAEEALEYLREDDQ